MDKERTPMFKTVQASPGKKLRSNKLVLGFAALAATAVIGTTGIAAAQTGSGYGGNSNSANISLNLDVNGNNNVISIILRPIINIFN
jgi:hypothetical protein